MTRLQVSRTARCIRHQRHVLGSLKALAWRSIECTAEAPRAVVIEPRSIILEMEDQPELEAWVGYRQADVVLAAWWSASPSPG
jgi:hypothetical protein